MEQQNERTTKQGNEGTIEKRNKEMKMREQQNEEKMDQWNDRTIEQQAKKITTATATTITR